jgi:hypothetical protein
MRQSWSETIQGLGASVLSLVRAELEVLEKELSISAKNLGIGLGLLGAAAAFGFWTLGVATYFLIHLVAIWLPVWGAALVVTGAFGLVVGGLAFAGLKKLQKFENPVGTVRRRLEDNMDWWQTRVVGPAEVGSRLEERRPLDMGRGTERGGERTGMEPEDGP